MTPLPRPGHHAGLGIVLCVSQVEVMVRIWFPLEWVYLFQKKNLFIVRTFQEAPRDLPGENVETNM